MAAPTEYVAEGDGFGSLLGPEDPIIRAAARGDIPEVRRQLSLGQSVAGALYHPVCLNEVASVEAILEAGGNGEINARARFGWTFLGLAASSGHVKLARVLLAAGADPDRRVVNHVYNHTPLAMATRGAQEYGTNIPPPYAESQRIFYLLLRAGATLEGMIRVVVPLVLPEGLQFGPAKLLVDTDDQYLRKVVAAGGFRNYEKAHRQALAKTFARVVFPRLPVDALSHVVAFAFHTGAY